MQLLRRTAIAALVSMVSMSAFALTNTDSHTVTMTVNEIALIDLDDTTGITLTIVAPATGGQQPANATNATKRLQYTSVVSPAATRTITVSWGGAQGAPAGTSLLAEITGITSTIGTCGTVAGSITVSTTATSLVNGIGGCATGVGGTDGAALQYTLQIDDFTLLEAAQTTNETLTFTLTEDL